MASYSDYTNYFEQVAIDLLSHTENEKHFFKKGVDEFLGGLSTDVNYPALLLDNYDFRYEDNGYDNYMKVRTVAIMIVDYVSDETNYNEIDTAYESMELIIDKMVNRMREDKQWDKHPFLKDFDYNNVEITPVKNPASNLYGFFVTVDIKSVHDYTITA